MSEELKPCPFCGSSGELGHAAYNAWYFVHCTNPNCDVTPEYDLGESGAIANWNSRPIETALRAQLAALEEENRHASVSCLYCDFSISYIRGTEDEDEAQEAVATHALTCEHDPNIIKLTKQQAVLRDALHFIENFGNHRHFQSNPAVCSHCLLISEIKAALEGAA